MNWDTLNCANHSDRPAIERCEVCGKPLCAYCLYYTEDGQRLCEQHAQDARLLGLAVEAPGAYADQLIGAQAAVIGKRKRGAADGDDTLYRGNSHDLLALIGLIVGVIALTACCGGFYCLPLVAFILSLIGLINAKNAYDPSRTRKLSVAGLLVSGVWVLLLVGCILTYGASLSAITTSFQPIQFQQLMNTGTPVPASTATPTTTLDPLATGVAPDTTLDRAVPTLTP
ncbi:B-box zinc finger protein [Aggregatilinea lenta]|uniref:B-box zinc finger protein n=1 Tax=Aggregatilinea lenta TaxID=913108 RepID=UPI000E5C1305|nr:B-box zinc finger protein [Aggregatilinea lenta]